MRLDQDDKRENIRYNIAVPLHYQIRGTSQFGNTISKNLSKGGISFILDRFIKPATRVNLDVNLSNRSINSTGEVKWSSVLSRSNKYQVGLKFLDIASQDMRYISDFLTFASPQKEIYKRSAYDRGE